VLVREHRQPGGWIDFRRSADDQEYLAAPRSVLGGRECAFRQQFLEPNDVRSQERTAIRTPWNFAVSSAPFLDDRAFLRALHPGDVAVQLDELLAAGALMQSVDVLGDEQEFRDLSFQLDERAMPCVRFD